MFCITFAKTNHLKLLFVANRIPFPPYRGDKLKIFNLAKQLGKAHRLKLISFYQHPSEKKYQKNLEEHFDEVVLIYQPKSKSVLECIKAIPQKMPFQIAFFRNANFQKALDKMLDQNDFDAIHTQHLRMSQYTQHLNVPVVLDLPDAYSMYWERRKQLKRSWYNRFFDFFESRRVIQYEKVVEQYPLSLLCSVEDLKHMKKTHPNARFGLLRNGVDLDTFRFANHDYDHNHTLLFTGNMDYAPNVDGVVHFVKNLLPKIREQYPKVVFKIVGQRPVKTVLDLQKDGIEVTGFVEDLSVAYNEASILVAPLRFGAGTQNKVIESMAMGLPVVCTHIGFEGLEIESGQGAIKTESDEDFIHQVIKLLEDPELRQKVGLAGRDKAINSYGWKAQSNQLEQYFEQITSGY
jgi:sugar transferase (PEP-CTERM/EpsH1 system associated)